MITAARTRWIHRTPRLKIALAVAVCAAAFYGVDHEFTVSQSLETLQEQSVDLDDLVAQGSGSRRAGFALVGLLGIAGLVLPGRRDFSPLSFGAAMLATYFAWCFASALWADDLPLTLRRFGVLTFMILGILGLGRQFTIRDVCWFILGVSTLHLMIGIYAEIRLGTLRPWGSEYRFGGTIHPNNQGVQLAGLALAAICLASQARRGRWILWLLAALACLFLWLTKSRTSCAGMALGILVLWLPSASRFYKASLFIFLPSLAAGWMLVAYMFQWRVADKIASIALMGRGEEADTLTGRLPLWVELSDYVRDQPWFGYGYGSFWNVARMRRISESQGWQIAHSHSAYLETVLNLGVIGVAILLVAVLIVLVVAMFRYRATGDDGYRFVCGFTAFAALYSTTDAVFAQPGFPTLAWLASLAIVAFSRQSEQSERSERSERSTQDAPAAYVRQTDRRLAGPVGSTP